MKAGVDIEEVPNPFNPEKPSPAKPKDPLLF
jgi:hypothetical protein